MVLKVGLTGATGMLGRHLQAILTAASIEVVPVSRVGKNISEWNLVDWLQHDELDKLFPNVQSVVHAGAMVTPVGVFNQAEMFNANVRSCLNLGQWAFSRGISFVHISGAIVYKNPFRILQKETSTIGWNEQSGFYGLSKLLAEDVLLRLRRNGLKLALLRPTSIYGHGLGNTKIVKRFLTISKSAGNIELQEPVEDCVDLVHASDVANAVVATLKQKSWKTFNISSGNPISFRLLARACLEATGTGKIICTGKIPQGYKPMVKYSLDINQAAKILNWKPVVDFGKGLDMMLKECYNTND